ncbi:uncharacterized protein BO72DRAFT_503577 [Aspergillus fijiensis CBS 313.89]|uniref:Uncharacterized protein n=1 Tax=Aspergillus fijiensis CBS 313.89 TaxID=1448319 RepID=A0A8G1RGF8_9EURO|nr:uncharacterized protein BO72DRAFT_503577 [Aspergillus fijiensis CBS 313.89]RAK71350.1 hypothetical protein BO72DRAFT_503577 [Aspergillus fijiensis CBS 313.89]
MSEFSPREILDPTVYFMGEFTLEGERFSGPICRRPLPPTTSKARPFEYTGQPANLDLIEQIAELLEQNKIPFHVVNDVIPQSLQKQAVQVLRKANFDDSCSRIENICLQKDHEGNYEAAPCNYIYNLRANFHRAWWVPAHIFHLQPAAPGEELHVDLNLFSHEDWFPNVKLPDCSPLAEDYETYLVSTDTRLASCEQATYEVKLFQPARMVEALIRLAYRDYYLYGPQHLDYIPLSDSCKWVEELSNIFSSLISEKEEDSTAAGAGEPRSEPPPPWARARVNEAFTEAAELTLRGLDPRWLRLEDFHRAWFFYLKMLSHLQDTSGDKTSEKGVEVHPFRVAFHACTGFAELSWLPWSLKNHGVFPEDTSPFPMKSILA